MTQERIKHLEFIQAVITRMNSNSFQIKGWAITIVSALLALYANSSNAAFIFVAIAPTILFWIADAYCLMQERRFRSLYNDFAEITPIEERKSTTIFDMDISKYKGIWYCKNRCWRCIFSLTIVGLYGLICVALFICGILLFKDCITFNS